jgi:cell division protein FtsW (lipid II flippase)
MSSSPLAAARRGSELGLILMAAVITGAAYTLASLAQDSVIPPIIVPFLIGVIGMLVAAHIANRFLAKGADGTLLPLAVILHGIGYVMIARLDDRLAGLQTTWTFVAIVAYIGVLLFVEDPRRLVKYRWWYAVTGIGLLLLPLVPGVGVTFGGARIWVSIGPINFQPGEFAKIILALFFASYLADTREVIVEGRRIGPIRLPDLRRLLPILLGWGFAVMIMVAQRDLGSSLMFFSLFVVMMWVATERAGYLVLGFGSFAGATYLAWHMFDHVKDRVAIWRDPWPLYEGKGYQPVQSMFAFANGGVGGTGLGLGNPTKIPAAKNDFIYAAIGEELGLLGATAVLVAFILMIGAGLRIALRSERSFDKLLATGLTTIIGVQAFIIIGGVIRLVPLTGITLPFVSYGGSSLISNYILLALLMRISDSSARRLREVPDELTISERWEARAARREAKQSAKDALRRPPVAAAPPAPPAVVGGHQ